MGLFCTRALAGGFGFGVVAFVLEDAAFEGWGFGAMAAAVFFAFGLAGGLLSGGAGFEGGAESLEGADAVLGLAAFILAADFEA